MALVGTRSVARIMGNSVGLATITYVIGVEVTLTLGLVGNFSSKRGDSTWTEQ